MTELQGLVWSKQDAEKALKKHAFIRVSPSDKRSTRQMSGAERVWGIPESKNEVYLTTFRISGKKENVRKALLRAGYSESQVEDALKNAITSENYKTTRKEDYDNEIASLALYKASEKERKKRDEIDWDTLLKIASNVKQTHVIMKDRGSPRKTGRGMTLIQRFDAIQGDEGKMINVTNMREDTTGAQTRNKPQTERGQMVYIKDVPIMSKTKAKYMEALKILRENNKFETDKDYQTAVSAAQAKFDKKARAKR